MTNHISHIDLSQNPLGDNGAILLSECFPKSTSLVHLDLSSTHITRKGANEIFIKLSQNKSIICLLLSTSAKHIRNCFSGMAPQFLPTFLNKAENLTFLELNSVMLGDPGLNSLYQGLEKSRSIRKLYLKNNHFTEKSAKIVLLCIDRKSVV